MPAPPVPPPTAPTGEAPTAAAADPVEAAVDEVAGVARLAGALVDELAVPVRDTHRAVADRVFGVLGPVAAPVRLAHDGIVGAVYTSVRGGARLAGAAAGTVAAATHRRADGDRRTVTSHPLGAQATAFLSGLLGTWVGERAADLAVRPSLTHHGRPVPTDPAALARDVACSDRLVLLVHGLAETTAAWGWWSTDADGAPVPTYAQRLEGEGWTPLEVGYDTGLPVAESGRALAEVVAALVDGWPGPLTEVALVGHSMGGLVVGAACEHGVRAGAAWPERVSHVVTLGTPHRGSWLAQGAAGAVRALDLLPETRGLAGIIELRSAGIRDLTHGWAPTPEPDAAGDAGATTVVATLADLLPHAHHAYVAATLGGTGRHPLSRLVGDGLVHLASSTGPATDADDRPNVVVRHHPGVGHVRLVHHPAVGDDLVSWLGPRRPAP